MIGCEGKTDRRLCEVWKHLSCADGAESDIWLYLKHVKCMFQ
jgi:hypothetical protein